MKLLRLGLLATAVAGLASAALAAGVFTPGMPAMPLPPAATYQFPLDTELSGGAAPQSAYATFGQLASFNMSVAGSGGWRNALVGGDFGTNLWQRGTTFSTIANTATYTADRWNAVGAATSEIAVSKQTGASDITQGFTASLRFGRLNVTDSNANQSLMCVSQVVPSSDATRFQGNVAEFRLHLLAGSGMSATAKAVSLVIASGTGVDEGAAGLNGGTWTGFSATTQSTTIGTSWDIFSAIATIPVTATEIGVKVCYLPVGNPVANDYVEFTGAQLDVNPSAVAKAGAVNSALISSFERRPQAIENVLQYRFFVQLNETNTSASRAAGGTVGTTQVRAYLQFPVPMFSTPTMTYTTGFGGKDDTAATNGTFTACSAVASVAASISPTGVTVNCTGSGWTANTGAQLIDAGGAGVIKASSEL